MEQRPAFVIFRCLPHFLHFASSLVSRKQSEERKTKFALLQFSWCQCKNSYRSPEDSPTHTQNKNPNSHLGCDKALNQFGFRVSCWERWEDKKWANILCTYPCHTPIMKLKDAGEGENEVWSQSQETDWFYHPFIRALHSNTWKQIQKLETEGLIPTLHTVAETDRFSSSDKKKKILGSWYHINTIMASLMM